MNETLVMYLILYEKRIELTFVRLAEIWIANWFMNIFQGLGLRIACLAMINDKC